MVGKGGRCICRFGARPWGLAPYCMHCTKGTATRCFTSSVLTPDTISTPPRVMPGVGTRHPIKALLFRRPALVRECLVCAWVVCWGVCTCVHGVCVGGPGCGGHVGLRMGMCVTVCLGVCGGVGGRVGVWGLVSVWGREGGAWVFGWVCGWGVKRGVHGCVYGGGGVCMGAFLGGRLRLGMGGVRGVGGWGGLCAWRCMGLWWEGGWVRRVGGVSVRRCVCVCVCVPRNPFESAPTAWFNNPKALSVLQTMSPNVQP